MISMLKRQGLGNYTVRALPSLAHSLDFLLESDLFRFLYAEEGPNTCLTAESAIAAADALNIVLYIITKQQYDYYI